MPAEEIFDVVDAQDRPVGRAARREVHARGLRHRAIHVLIFNRRGEIFLQRRSALKDMSPLTWDSSCSGHVDAGEDYDQACVRELGEELGLHLDAPPPRWLRVAAGPETGNEFVWVYRLQHEGPFTLDPAEIDRGEWIAPAELDRRIAGRPADYAPAFRLIWRRRKE
ncbi:MAG TPA: NUDIX domain-containing protein [Opitutaceae bacterium]|jgi:isopentenyl-diphosphate delta-isomerase type 1|nr:NUDIX domain-containing protein [Opitutaceae bacterium]